MIKPTVISLLALAVAGCGFTPTGESWSTKAESSMSSPAGLPAPVLEGSVTPRLLYDAAVSLLQDAAQSSNALLRANAIEAMQHAPQYVELLLRLGVIDDNHGVRFVAAMTIGELRLVELSHLLAPLLVDESESVQAAALFGLYRCGQPVDLAPLATMIASGDPEVRANAALVLGELGNPSSAPVIRAALGGGSELVSAARLKVVDLQMAEALVKLGDEQQIQVIRAALFAPAEQGEITALACMMCGRLGDEKAVPNLVRLARTEGQFRQAAEIRMAATWALAQIAPGEATMEVPLEFVSSDQDRLRVQAALTLGEIGDPAALEALAAQLEDYSALVQVAAASAILQIEAPLAGGRNRPEY